MSTNLMVKLGLESRSYVNGLRTANNETKKFSKNVQSQLAKIDWKRAAIGVAAFSTAVVYSSVKLANMASVAEETQNKFDAVFKSLSKEADAWAKDFADSVGRSTTEVRGHMATLQDTFVPLGFARDRAMELSQSLTRLAVDVASFNNQADAQVLQNFTSAIVGNHEAVRSYGIVITESALKQEALLQGLQKTYSQLSETEKAMLRYSIILKSTSDAQGDALRTAGSYANQVKRMEANIRDFQESLGQNLLPVFTDIVSNLNSWIDANEELMSQNIESWAGKITKAFDKLGWTVKAAAAAIKVLDHMEENFVPRKLYLGAKNMMFPPEPGLAYDQPSGPVTSTMPETAEMKQNRLAKEYAGMVSFYQKYIQYVKQKRNSAAYDSYMAPYRGYVDYISGKQQADAQYLDMMRETNLIAAVGSGQAMSALSRTRRTGIGNIRKNLGMGQDITQQTQSVFAFQTALQKTADTVERMKVAWTTVGDTISSTLANAMLHVDNFGEGIRRMLRSITAEISSRALVWSLFQLGSSGNNPLGGFTESVFGRFLEPRAAGGPVTAGRPYLVGERGPELMVPNTSGKIVPNGGGGMQLTVNVNGMSDRELQRRILQAFNSGGRLDKAFKAVLS